MITRLEQFELLLGEAEADHSFSAVGIKHGGRPVGRKSIGQEAGPAFRPAGPTSGMEVVNGRLRALRGGLATRRRIPSCPTWRRMDAQGAESELRSDAQGGALCHSMPQQV